MTQAVITAHIMERLTGRRAVVSLGGCGFLAAAFLFAATALSAVPVRAEDYVLTLQAHRFSPDPIILPAGQKIKLTVKNAQSTPAEFESSDLDREKLVQAGRQAIVLLGPLDPGKYAYFDDFHRETLGTIIVK